MSHVTKYIEKSSSQNFTETQKNLRLNKLPVVDRKLKNIAPKNSVNLNQSNNFKCMYMDFFFSHTYLTGKRCGTVDLSSSISKQTFQTFLCIDIFWECVFRNRFILQGIYQM